MHAIDETTMAARQGATPPTWLHRSRWDLLTAAVGGPRQNLDKLIQVLGLLLALFRPGLVRRRLARLAAAGLVDTTPSISQLLVAARDQMVLNAGIETKRFYESQRIPWAFHNLRRFIAGPATMMDPVGLFSPRDTIVHHVLQTFHRHPVYDFALLTAHENGLESLRKQAEDVLAGRHGHQAALTSLIEDGSYHARLPGDIAAFAAAPVQPARPIPPGLVTDPEMMLGMDQFKDIRGLCRYATRLNVRPLQALTAWLVVAFDVTVGDALGIQRGPKHIRIDACDQDLVDRHIPSAP